ncbi:MAG: preprotein translocase subunit SecE [Terracidiphilus sp.]
MATKTAIERGDERSGKRQEPGALQEFGGNAMGAWTNFTGFLSDVRAEMRKVVSPTWNDVRTTTFVVIITVALFGLFFFIVDNIFSAAIMGPHGILSKLGGSQ